MHSPHGQHPPPVRRAAFPAKRQPETQLARPPTAAPLVKGPYSEHIPLKIISSPTFTCSPCSSLTWKLLSVSWGVGGVGAEVRVGGAGENGQNLNQKVDSVVGSICPRLCVHWRCFRIRMAAELGVSEKARSQAGRESVLTSPFRLQMPRGPARQSSACLGLHTCGGTESSSGPAENPQGPCGQQGCFSAQLSWAWLGAELPRLSLPCAGHFPRNT